MLRRFLYLISISLIFLSCEEDIKEERTGIPVCFSLLDPNLDVQTVFVDTTYSIYEKSDTFGVSGAEVYIHHGDSVFKCEEENQGVYTVNLKVIPGETYRIEVRYRNYIIEDDVYVLNKPVIVSPPQYDTVVAGDSTTRLVWHGVDSAFYYRIYAVYPMGDTNIALFPIFVHKDTSTSFFKYVENFPYEGTYIVKVIAYPEDYAWYSRNGKSDWDTVFGLFSSINYDERYLYIKKTQP